MKWKPISLESLGSKDQYLIEERIKELNSPFSEYSFAYIFLFRKMHQYELSENTEVIRGVHRDLKPFYLPLVRKPTLPFEELYPIEEKDLPFWKGQGYEIKSFEKDSDYIYPRMRFLDYMGKGLDGQRNFLHQFLRNEVVTSRDWEEGDEKEALSILKRREHTGDKEECTQAILYRERLHLRGRITFCNGVAAGFTLGAQTQNQFILHFAKGDISFKGIYPYLYHDLAKHCDVELFNFEEDLGIDSLRKAKSSYHPLLLLPKYCVFSSLK